jgi:hypothetical protein
MWDRGAGKRMQKGALPSQSEQMHRCTLARQRLACTMGVVDSLCMGARVE